MLTCLHNASNHAVVSFLNYWQLLPIPSIDVCCIVLIQFHRIGQFGECKFLVHFFPVCALHSTAVGEDWSVFRCNYIFEYSSGRSRSQAAHIWHTWRRSIFACGLSEVILEQLNIQSIRTTFPGIFLLQLFVVRIDFKWCNLYTNRVSTLCENHFGHSSEIGKRLRAEMQLKFVQIKSNLLFIIICLLILMTKAPYASRHNDATTHMIRVSPKHFPIQFAIAERPRSLASNRKHCLCFVRMNQTEKHTPPPPRTSHIGKQ